METGIIFIIFITVPPPSTSPNQIFLLRQMLGENMIGDMSGNEELPDNKERHRSLRKADGWTWLVKVTNTQQQSQFSDYPLFAKGHNHISQCQVLKALKML